MRTKIFTLLLTLSGLALTASAQKTIATAVQTSSQTESVAERPWLMSAEPSFPGGQEALVQYLAEHVRIPDFLLSQGREGHIDLLLVINTEGCLERVSLIDVPLPPEDQRVLKGSIVNMPDWQPAIQGGRAVTSKVLVPLWITQNMP